MATTHQVHPGTVFMKGLAGSTVWWPGTDSDLGEPGRGNTLQASRHHLSLELAVPWAMQEAWSGPNSKNSRPSRGRGFWVVLSSLPKGSEGFSFHLKSCCCSNNCRSSSVIYSSAFNHIHIDHSRISEI